jgi:hypothetical protein
MRIVFLLQTYHKNSLSEKGEMPYLLNIHLNQITMGAGEWIAFMLFICTLGLILVHMHNDDDGNHSMK